MILEDTKPVTQRKMLFSQFVTLHFSPISSDVPVFVGTDIHLFPSVGLLQFQIPGFSAILLSRTFHYSTLRDIPLFHHSIFPLLHSAVLSTVPPSRTFHYPTISGFPLFHYLGLSTVPLSWTFRYSTIPGLSTILLTQAFHYSTISGFPLFHSPGLSTIPLSRDFH